MTDVVKQTGLFVLVFIALSTAAAVEQSPSARRHLVIVVDGLRPDAA